MIYGFGSGKIWQRPCSAIPACHGNIPLHHKFPLHSVKVFVPYENVLFGNLLHKGFWGPVTFFWQGVQHFSNIILVVIEDEYTHLLLETAIISTRFLFTDVTECICTLCLYCCMYSVCRCVCVLLCVYVIRFFYVCVTCCDLYVTINLSETEREKVRGNNNDLSYVPSKTKKQNKNNNNNNKKQQPLAVAPLLFLTSNLQFPPTIYIGIFFAVGSGVIVLKWSFLFLWPDCKWWWVSPLSDHCPWRFILRMVGIWSSRASSWATGGFWSSWGACGGAEGSRNEGSSPVNVRKAFLKEDLHIIQSCLPLRSQSSVEQEACCHTVSPLVVMVASLSQCAKGWQPEPCIGHQLQWWQQYEWLTC